MENLLEFNIDMRITSMAYSNSKSLIILGLENGKIETFLLLIEAESQNSSTKILLGPSVSNNNLLIKKSFE